MGLQATFTIHPKCIQPRVHLSNNPACMNALKFDSHGLAHAMFFTGKENDLSHLSSRSSANQPHAKIKPPLQDYLKWELAGRFAMVRAYVEPRPAQHKGQFDLTLTPLAQKLDPSEKACLSYFLGQAITGIYCYNTLNVVQLLHTSLASRHFNLQPGKPGKPRTRRRPDLIGIDTRLNGIVAEAKGRTQASKKRLEDLAVDVDNQLRSVWLTDSLDYTPCFPWCPIHQGSAWCYHNYPLGPCYYQCHRIGCIASFRTPKGPMRLHVLDDRCPSLHGAAGYKENVPLDGLLRSTLLYQCYSRVCTAVGNDPTSPRESDAANFRTVELPDVGITFGVLDSIYELVAETRPDERADPVELQRFMENLDDILASLDTSDARIFSDGTFFEADWPLQDRDDTIES